MIRAYHRPATLEEALSLLGRTGVKSAALLGYAALIDTDPTVDEVVDLQKIPLNQISISGAHLTIEALTFLQAVADHPDLPEWLREIARQEEPSTFRNMRTLGSILFNPNAESVLLAVLLVCDAQVSLQMATGQRQVSLTEFLADAGYRRGAVLPTAVTLETNGSVRVDAVARTPADRPIVAAVARKRPTGETVTALCGVATTPVLIDPTAIESLEPIGDFRGSPVYRKAMARTLVERVLASVSG